MSDTLYTCLILEDDPLTPFVQVYWAYGSHMGEALEAMRRAAIENGLRRPRWEQCDPFDLRSLPEEVLPYRESDVFWSPDRFGFPPDEREAIPYGVVASCTEGDFDVDDITFGYRIDEEEEVAVIEANIPDERLLDDFVSLLHAHEPLRVFWYQIHDHWDDSREEEFFVDESLSSAVLIRDHLLEHRSDGLRNGFVTLTAYAREGATNVSITDHKIVRVSSTEKDRVRRSEDVLRNLGYERRDPFVTIARGIHHWHFRDPRSADRDELPARLRGLGFSPWTPGRRT